MNYDIMLTGVGGEGVLTTQVVLARAAHYQGYMVEGVQLHGLAQRGGHIPAFVRLHSFNQTVSPAVMQANADLVLAFEPLESVRAAYYARKDKTVFVINDDPLKPVYGNILDIPYPSMDEIKKRISGFAKDIHIVRASEIAKQKLGKKIYGNILMLGYAKAKGLLPISEKNIIKAVKETVRYDVDKNLKAFRIGLEMGR